MKQEELKKEMKLTKAQFEAYLEVSKVKEISMKELIEKLKKDRTSILRSLNKLIAKDLITKRQQNLHKGYMFVYYIKDRK